MPATPAWPPRSAPRLFVDEAIALGSSVAVEGNHAHYLARVMRLGVGDAVILCDDVTGEWVARVASVDKREMMLDPVERLREREAVPDFWLCAALLKKDRFDLVLEKATELGVARIQPVITRRCVADKLNMERARTLVREAAEQCARTALPELCEPVKLDPLLRDWPKERALFFADELGGARAATAFEARRAHERKLGPQATQHHLGGDPGLRRDSAPASLLTGPEGGFDDAERAAIREHEASVAISLGPRTLRGETAAIAATALWMVIAGDWGE